MNCMKCGRETPSEQVFCDDCLAEMEKYPVKPGTVVLLPRRRDPSAAKKTVKRRAVPLEDQVKLLKKRVKNLTIALAVCLLLLALGIAYMVDHLSKTHFKPGQNYNTSVSTSIESVEIVEK